MCPHTDLFLLSCSRSFTPATYATTQPQKYVGGSTIMRPEHSPLLKFIIADGDPTLPSSPLSSDPTEFVEPWADTQNPMLGATLAIQRIELAPQQSRGAKQIA